MHEQVGALDEGELGLDERHETAVERTTTPSRRRPRADRDGARGRTRTLDLDAPARRAGPRADPQGRRRRPAGGRLAAAGRARIGRRPAHRRTRHEAALAAALGAVADAVAVSSADDAGAALRLLKTEDAGRAGLIVGGATTPLIARNGRSCHREPRGPWISCGRRTRCEVRSTGPWRRSRWSTTWTTQSRLVAQCPGIRVVTRAGTCSGPDWAAGGSPSAPSTIEIQAAVDEAQQNADEAAARHEKPRRSSRPPRPALRSSHRGSTGP